MNEFMENVWRMLVESNLLNIIGSLMVLLLGWIVALVAKKVVFESLKRMNLGRKLAICLPEESPSGPSFQFERIVSVLVFWGVFLFTLVATLNSLRLTDAAEPIRNFLTKITDYLPNLLGGLILLFLAWLIATGLKYLAITAMQAFELDEKIEAKMETDGKPCELSSSIATVLYWLVFLCFAPTVLRALKISGITEPLQKMLETIFGYLPNLIAAAAILAAGFFLAGIVRRVIVRVVSALRFDLLRKSGEPGKFFEMENLANLIGIVVYALLLVPIIIAALNALKIDGLSQSVSGLFAKILNAGGNMFGAALVLVVACIAGRIFSRLASQAAEHAGVNRLPSALGFAPEGKTPVSLSAALGKLTFAAILFFSVIAAFQILGFGDLATLLTGFVPFAGKILVAIVVFALGIYLANLAGTFIKTKGFESQLLAFVVKLMILFFAGAVALHSTDIGEPIVMVAFTLILGAVAVAAAIAFGIGGREFAARKLEEWSRKKDQ